MECFRYRNGVLHCEDVSLLEIAKQVGTPFYCYSLSYIEKRFKEYKDGFAGKEHLICYAIKANSNLSVLHFLASLGSGADIVSGGELFRALKAGINPQKIVYSGVGKKEEEIRYALREGILMLNVESLEELELISQVASSIKKKAPIAFRVNPDVDPKTHPYISTGLKKNKFGLSIDQALYGYKKAIGLEWIDIKGIDCHIGSQILETKPFIDAFKRVKALVQAVEQMGINISYIDIGGGLGISYKEDEVPPDPISYVKEILEEAKGLDRKTIIVEPGRSIVGNSGALVTKILYFKDNSNKSFYIVDAAMNDLGRPSLYDAYHQILPVVKPDLYDEVKVDIVGPICETGDFFARDRMMPKLDSGAFLAVMNSGAYGFSMSSNYNSRPRVPEIVVRGNKFFVARERETYEDLIGHEKVFDVL